MDAKKFRVVIVGGSIAGLTLALALEKHDIDFVVLEAYPEIASQVGASIAVLPNGFRVLDQLGCFEDIMERVNCTIDNFVIRDLDGSVLIHVENLDHHLVQRHGYPMIFFERRMLVEVLYQHIKKKQNVLTQKRVVGIQERADGVTVTTEDGEQYEADILVGADGVHSAVGKHVWQTTIHKDHELRRDEMPVQYRCLFGISSKVPGIAEDTLHHVSNEGSSLFAASGPNDRTYWCLFTNTGTTYYGEDLPPYKEKDVAETARKHSNDGVTETVKFGDLYDQRIMVVQTPLHEYVLGRWHSQRCIVIGDAAHKFNPIIGLGGMSAIETCAALTNGLVSLLESHKASGISSSSVESVFRETQEIRKPRATALVDVSQKTQYRFAMETPLLKLFNRYYFPGMGSRSALRLLSEAYPGAVSVKTLPVPKQPRTLPYEDELLQQPVPRNVMLSRVTVATLFGIFLFRVKAILAVGTSARPLGRSVPASGLNQIFRTFLTSCWMVDGVMLQAGYFFVSVTFPLVVIILIESYRKRNTWSSVWCSTLWITAAQVFGLGIVLPLYILAFYSSSERTAYWMPAERSIPKMAGKALLISLLVGLLSPAVFIALYCNGSDETQKAVSLWHATPILVSVLCSLVTKFVSGPIVPKDGKAPVEDYQGYDLPYTRMLYNIVFLVAAGAHVLALISGTGMSGLLSWKNQALGYDLLSVGLTVFVWMVTNVQDMRRVGISGLSVWKSAGILLASELLIGPGATTVAFWRWREEKMAKPELRVL